MIADACGAEVTIDAGLAECDFGAWEGLTFAEARAAWPVEHDAWLGSTALAPPGGESLDTVAARVRESVEQTRSAYPASGVVIVSHVSPLRLLLRDALGAGNELLHRLVLDPGGFSIVDIWPDGGVAVQQVNEICHLDQVRAGQRSTGAPGGTNGRSPGAP
jgi:probable phosphoglycerate mutase